MTDERTDICDCRVAFATENMKHVELWKGVGEDGAVTYCQFYERYETYYIELGSKSTKFNKYD